MAYCSNCGTQISKGIKFCISCGTPIAVAAQVAEQQLPPPSPQTVQHQPIQQTPVYAAPPAATVYQEEPISTGGYVGILLLLLIPLVNLICVIIWACGGSRKCNKTNLARALLVWMLIGTVLAVLIFLVGSLIFGDQIKVLNEFGSLINGGIVE